MYTRQKVQGCCCKPVGHPMLETAQGSVGLQSFSLDLIWHFAEFQSRSYYCILQSFSLDLLMHLL